MMRKTLAGSSVVLSLCVLVAGTAAHASGFYIGASAGQSEVDFGSGDLGLGSLLGIDLDDTDTGWKVFGGYRFLRFLGVELDVVDLGEGTITAEELLGSSEVSASVDGYSVSVVGVLPLGSHLELFAKSGRYFWDSELTLSLAGLPDESVSNDGDDIRYGAGAGWNFGQRLGVRGEWERFEIDDVDVDLISIGVTVRF